MKRRTVVISAVSGAVVLGIATILIVGARGNASKKLIGEKITTGSTDVASFFQYTPRDPGALEVALPTTVTASPTLTLPPPKDKNNLTDQLAYLFTTNLAGSTSSPDEAMAAAQQGLANLSAHKLFTESDIIVTNDNSPAAQKRYLEAYLTAVGTTLSSININSLQQDLSSTNFGNNLNAFQTLSARIPRILTALLAIPAPSEWTQVHLMLLNLWQREGDIYDALVHYEDDPLKAILAMEELPNVIQMSQTLQTQLSHYYAALAS